MQPAKIKPFKEQYDAVDWMKDFEAAAELNEWTTDAAKVSGLKLHLQGEAREWLRDQKSDDWKSLKDQFISEFGGFKKMTRDSFSKLIHFKQRYQENLMNYTQRFKKLVQQHQRETSQDKTLTELKAADLKRIYIKGISDQSQRREIRRATTQILTLKELYEYAEEYWRKEASESEEASDSETESEGSAERAVVQALMEKQVINLSLKELSMISPVARSEMKRLLTKPHKKPKQRSAEKASKDRPCATMASVTKQTGVPRAWFQVNSLRVETVLDACATQSMISLRLVAALGIEEITATTIVHGMADGSRSKSLGLVENLHISYGNHKTVISASVLNNDDYDLLVDINVLHALRVVVDFDNHSWYMKTDEGAEPMNVTYKRSPNQDFIPTGMVTDVEGTLEESSDEETSMAYLFMETTPDEGDPVEEKGTVSKRS
jgi:hypothetical protein